MSEMFGLLFAEIRKHKKLSQEEISKRSGLKKSAISKIERGRQKVKLEELYSLSEAVCMTADELISELNKFIYMAKKLPVVSDEEPEVIKLRLRLLARDLCEPFS